MSSSSWVKGSSPGGAGYLLVKLELRGGEDIVVLLCLWAGCEVGDNPDTLGVVVGTLY
jgi:hypothetical protein